MDEAHADTGTVETWTMYDADRIPTGTTMRRGDDFRPGELHVVVHVCIFDDAGRMLIQRRTDDKVGWPGMWDVTVGGSVTAGETSARGAEREVFEELGICLDLTGRRPNFTFNFRHGFDDFYLLRAADSPRADLPPVDSTTLAIPNDEVADARWATRDEIHALHADGRFIPYRPTAIDFVFDMLGRADILDLADEGGRPGTDAADFG
ncbi:NUDIX domain-containing protein [uncultured Corynebacterium sp.]|uniref:NUDIX hydrolase n=1 Tax=uncultured Corynebacterium sp. TaxID=159447 RepID=UPI0025EFA24F|nr:NUDIX domain-containing protein [uncultured Corynebacterium sp.]